MDARLQHITRLYEKFKECSASEAEIDEFFDLIKNPENLEILKNSMSEEWEESSRSSVQRSPLIWEDIQLQIRRKKALERKKVLERRDLRYKWTAAASILILIALAMVIFLSGSSDSYETYATGYGQVKKIVLDDGSQVTLNANSMLKWNRNWNEVGKRQVVLEGEAFFDVVTIGDDVSGEKVGFEVVTADLTIQVTGTSFNVKSRTSKTDVFLQTGQVILDLNEKPDPDSKETSERIIMNTGESVSYSAVTQSLEKSQSDQYGNASWMAGTFMFSKMPVYEILQSLEEIYGVSFEVKDQSILERQLTTNLPYSDWPIVESGLELLLQADLISVDGKIIINKKE